MRKYLLHSKMKKGSTYDTYSTYKNPNESLKQQIKDFKLEDTTTVRMGWPTRTWTIDSIEGKSVKCVDGKNVQYFPKAEIDEALAEKLENKRNMAFPAHKYFKECFGIITSVYKDKGNLYRLKKLSLGKAIPMSFDGKQKLNPLDLNIYQGMYDYQIDTYHGIALEVRIGAEMLNLHFNEEGDFVNRDYNCNLTEFDGEDLSPAVMLAELEKQIRSSITGKIFKAGKKYYTDKNCYIPYLNEEDHKIGVQMAAVRYDNVSYQARSGYPIHKKPAKAVEVTINDLIQDVLSLLTPSLKVALSDDYQSTNFPILNDESGSLCA